jgi:hypothetical protein
MKHSPQGANVGSGPILERTRHAFSCIAAEHRLRRDPVWVTVEPLSAEQSIGRPQRQGFALLGGREVMVEAEFRGSFGHAFTDCPQSFEGTIEDVLHLDLSTSANRAILISTLNAATSHLGIASGTRHCRDDDPEKCGSQIAHELLEDFGRVKVGLLGFQPAMLAHLTEHFGAENVQCTDLNPNNVGSCKYGVRIQDGRTDTGRIIDWSQLLLVTSSAIVNGTFDGIYEQAVGSQDKPLLVFGVTGAGVSALLGLRRICPFGR